MKKGLFILYLICAFVNFGCGISVRVGVPQPEFRPIRVEITCLDFDVCPAGVLVADMPDPQEDILSNEDGVIEIFPTSDGHITMVVQEGWVISSRVDSQVVIKGIIYDLYQIDLVRTGGSNG